MEGATGAAMTADREAWQLFRTNGAGEWEKVRSFDRLDDACRCIMQLEAPRSESLDMTLHVRVVGPTETELEFSYKSRGTAYHITNSV